ncbi:GntR family transcriptional regulator [Acetobacter sp. TBRC 12305]|uniref:GntR family transcriptional regulator n=1 Tax=Acetobacter garciniae TaxID=2817435 RepID=A0A939HJA1_9PROT|nr:GntR family transcriptional regulator [Acetobacter garciniae]MBO1325475.1 GntR family transcriptional regulator [Acetobacter garciniae]MBX0345353.1 GntR family transcriptional regulator [Acetobacter garciniae]
MQESTADRAYEYLHAMVVSFELRPGEHVNEVSLARVLGMSRAPVREALNRLASEGLVESVSGKGFFCRRLNPRELRDLYAVRADLEAGGLLALADRLAEPDLRARLVDLRAAWVALSAPGQAIEDMVDQDEAFHLALAGVSDNAERVKILRNINARIRFVRRINVERPERQARTLADHLDILNALLDGNAPQAAHLVRAHLQASAREIDHGVADGLLRLYTN